MEYLTHWLDMQDLFAYLLLGALAGLAAGLLGVGGGLIIVPTLIWIFNDKGIDAAIVTHLAVGTSLSTIVLTSVSSIIAHHRRGAVRWDLVGHLTPGIIIGAWLGATVAKCLPSLILAQVFGGFAILTAVHMLLDIHPKVGQNLPGRLGLGFAGGIIGCVSAIVGIGGGSMTVPFLSRYRVIMRQAVATSSACGLPIAIAGGLGFAVMGWGNPLLPLGSSGFIYWPAMFSIVISSILFAPVGAHFAHNVSSVTLKKIFALLLFLIGGKMIF